MFVGIAPVGIALVGIALVGIAPVGIGTCTHEIQRAAVKQLYYACVNIVDRISVVHDTYCTSLLLQQYSYMRQYSPVGGATQLPTGHAVYT